MTSNVCPRCGKGEVKARQCGGRGFGNGTNVHFYAYCTNKNCETDSGEDVDTPYAFIDDTDKKAIKAMNKAIHAFCHPAHITAGMVTITEKHHYDLYVFVRDVATNYDHEDDAHRYDTTCRMCDAEKLLEQMTKPVRGIYAIEASELAVEVESSCFDEIKRTLEREATAAIDAARKEGL